MSLETLVDQYEKIPKTQHKYLIILAAQEIYEQ